jgi:hypothetical protein
MVFSVRAMLGRLFEPVRSGSAVPKVGQGSVVPAGGIMLVAMLTVTLKVGFAGGYDLNLACLGGLLALLLAGPGKPAVEGDL